MISQGQQIFHDEAMRKLRMLPQEDVLARLLYGEIRIGDFMAMCACGLTVMNRMEKPRWWGRNITDVCLKADAANRWHQYSWREHSRRDAFCRCSRRTDIERRPD